MHGSPLFLTHRWEPCQGESDSLTFINMTLYLSDKDTIKWPRIITLELKYILKILHGWMGGAYQAMADGQTKTKPYTSRMTSNPPPPPHSPAYLYSDSQPCVRKTFSASIVPQSAENPTYIPALCSGA